MAYTCTYAFSNAFSTAYDVQALCAIIATLEPWGLVGGGGDPRNQKWSQWRAEEAARLRLLRQKINDDRRMQDFLTGMFAEPGASVALQAQMPEAGAPRAFIDASALVAPVLASERDYVARRRQQDAETVQLLAMVM